MSLEIRKAHLKVEYIREIGFEGANSRVYLAHDPQMKATLVIKEIRKADFLHPAEYFTEAQKLYEAEHPNVVPIKYAGEDDNFIYVAMPYYKMGSLGALIDNRFLTVREIIRYSLQFLRGLNNIHVKNLIHFDVKPNNVLISDANEALVSDFGLAKSMNRHGISIPDQAYNFHIPPEVFERPEQTMLYDIYAAGLTIYRLCNGNAQFHAQASALKTEAEFVKAVGMGRFPDRNLFLPHIPKSLRSCIKKAINVNEGKRFPTILDFLNALNKVNDFLDWRYELIGADEQKWTNSQNGRSYEILVKKTGGNYDITTFKTILSSSKRTKVSAGSFKGISASELEDKLQNLFLSYG